MCLAYDRKIVMISNRKIWNENQIFEKYEVGKMKACEVNWWVRFWIKIWETNNKCKSLTYEINDEI